MKNRQTKKTGEYCSALFCRNARCKPECKGLSFFTLPAKDEERCRKWIQNMRREDLVGVTMKKVASTKYVICANHFEPSQFNVPAERKRLVFNAVPTLFDVPNPPPSVSLKRKCPNRPDVVPPNKKNRTESPLNLEPSTSIELEGEADLQWTEYALLSIAGDHDYLAPTATNTVLESEASKSESEGMSVLLRKALAKSEQREEETRKLIAQLQKKVDMMEEQLSVKDLQSECDRRNQVVERVSVTTPDFAYTSNLLSSIIKRKTDQCDSPTNSKMLTLKPPSINSGEINENNTSFLSSSLSDTNSDNSLSHDALVDNSGFIDYIITINQDFYSEEDMKPDVNELNAKIHEKDKPAGPVDIELDKNLLDQKLKEEPSYSKTLPAYDGNPLAIKEELLEEDANLPIERCNEDLLLTDRNKFPLNNVERGWRQSVAAESDTDKVYGSDGNRYCTNCKQHLQSFYSNVHQLLNLLCPDTSLGNVEDIEQTVQTMIHSHKERSQSLSQNFEIQRP